MVGDPALATATNDFHAVEDRVDSVVRIKSPYALTGTCDQTRFIVYLK
jgi:hypothetical protein